MLAFNLLFTDRLIFFPNGLSPKFKQKLKQQKQKKQQQKHQQKHQHGGYKTNSMASASSAVNLTINAVSNHIDGEMHNELNEAQMGYAVNTAAGVGGSLNNENNADNNEDDDDEDDDDDDDYDDRIRAEIYSNYPHYLHPPSWGLNNPLVLASHSPHTYEDDDVVVEVATTTNSANGKQHYQAQKQQQQQNKKPHQISLILEDLEQSVDDVVLVEAGHLGHSSKTSGTDNSKKANFLNIPPEFRGEHERTYYTPTNEGGIDTAGTHGTMLPKHHKSTM